MWQTCLVLACVLTGTCCALRSTDHRMPLWGKGGGQKGLLLTGCRCLLLAGAAICLIVAIYSYGWLASLFGN
jgi:hypothetical protein